MPARAGSERPATADAAKKSRLEIRRFMAAQNAELQGNLVEALLAAWSVLHRIGIAILGEFAVAYIIGIHGDGAFDGGADFAEFLDKARYPWA